MKGKDLDRFVRDAEILRLRTEENMTYRQIAERVGVSHVWVMKVLNAKIEETAESIRERRNHHLEQIERVKNLAYEKYMDSPSNSDLQAYIKAAQAYATLLGLNAPTVSVEVSGDYRGEWDTIFNESRTIDGTVVQ
ncbi:hypothetical protein [Micromonospora sp. NPDC047187]|uniref:hypothetical protein n=1 Tax=Micromonospora sp. NPDC047187 TaxID=3155262 RepID=UPI0033D1EC72